VPGCDQLTHLDAARSHQLRRTVFSHARVKEREGQILSWQSLPGAQVQTAGSVFFEDATGGRGMVVRVHLDLDPPGGGVGRAIGRMLAPITKHQVQEDLRRFKNLLEAGEIPTTEGQSAGRRPAINPHLLSEPREVQS